MQGFAFNTSVIMITALSTLLLNTATFATTTSAGCMGCHQGGTVNIDKPVVKTQQINPHKEHKPLKTVADKD